jgi:hypothetical protein
MIHEPHFPMDTYREVALRMPRDTIPVLETLEKVLEEMDLDEHQRAAWKQSGARVAALPTAFPCLVDTVSLCHMIEGR